jgi:hypothetical protein
VVFVRSADAASNKTSAAAAASAITSTAAAISTAAAAGASATTAGESTIEHPGKEFYDQLIATMKNFAAPQYQQKIVVKSREHEESVDLAKLQTSMLRLMYASGETDWDEGTVKNIQLATLRKVSKTYLTGRLRSKPPNWQICSPQFSPPTLTTTMMTPTSTL